MEKTQEKITEYFVSSPKAGDGPTAPTAELTKTPTKQGKPITEFQSPFLTPEKTPKKSTSTENLASNKDTSLAATEKAPSDSATTQESTANKATKQGGKRGRRKKAGKGKGPNVVDGTPDSTQPKPKTARTRKKKPEGPSRVLTDFFPVRRSDRRSKKDIELQEKEDLEKCILNECEDGLKVEEIEGKGRGVVSTKPFKRGDFVVVYAGDMIAVTEAKARESDYSLKEDLGCYMYYFNFQDRKYCVDATAESGKLGRLLNHSKAKANCMTKTVGIYDKPHLILVAKRDIKIGEELLYDYGDRSKSSLEAHPWLAY